MDIEYKKFVIASSANSSRFNLLERIIRTNKVTKEKTNETKVLGYDMSFEVCLSEILNLRLQEKKKTVTIKDYIEEYKKERQELLNILN